MNSILRLILRLLQELQSEVAELKRNNHKEILDELKEIQETQGLQADNISTLIQTVSDQEILLQKIDAELQAPKPGPPASIQLVAGTPF